MGVLYVIMQRVSAN